MNADKEIMENLLNTVKGVCDLYMHGTIESSTQNVHAAFDDALEESLCMQNEIYNQMSQQGWYPMEQAPQQQIDKVRGMDLCFVTTASNDEEARELLTLMGAPFAK